MDNFLISFFCQHTLYLQVKREVLFVCEKIKGQTRKSPYLISR